MGAERNQSLKRRAVAGRDALWALVSANARFWPFVAPVVRAELVRWEGAARAIEDAETRELALEKLCDEGFNAEVAATLVTLVPRSRRAVAARAMVALEVLFDYLDGRTERLTGDPLGEGERLYGALEGAVACGAVDEGEAPAHGGVVAVLEADYLDDLAACARMHWAGLPAAAAVADVIAAASRRCGAAQTRIHAAEVLGDDQLRAWAQATGVDSGLGWREYAAGAASSVLAMHALIAAASDSTTTREDAVALDSTYLAIGALVTLLDNLVDERDDEARGGRGLTRLFETTEELGDCVVHLVREARSRAERAPHGAHHVMTLAGVVAYYTSHPGARGARERAMSRLVRRELRPVIWPAVAVMASWRAAKRARAVFVPGAA